MECNIKATRKDAEKANLKVAFYIFKCASEIIKNGKIITIPF